MSMSLHDSCPKSPFIIIQIHYHFKMHVTDIIYLHKQTIQKKGYQSHVFVAYTPLRK
jgi:hypothetical protein